MIQQFIRPKVVQLGTNVRRLQDSDVFGINISFSIILVLDYLLCLLFRVKVTKYSFKTDIIHLFWFHLIWSVVMVLKHVFFVSQSDEIHWRLKVNLDKMSIKIYDSEWYTAVSAVVSANTGIVANKYNTIYQRTQKQTQFRR